jgi:hypothetical protein
MSEQDVVPQPVLADALLAPSPALGIGVASAGTVAVAVVLAAFWLSAPALFGSRSHIPASPADLGTGVITAIDANDRAAVDTAIAALKVDEPTRRQIEREVLAGNRRIGWVVVQDSMDPDGDTIAVESAGFSQQVVLAKAWIPVPVVLGNSNRIGITAIKDGAGGGITLALVTAGGQMPLRPLQPGEHVEVAAE